MNLGSIRGEVQDTQHAAVPNASLILRNESTGVVQAAKSGTAGQYGFLNLSAGRYTLTTEAQGFRTSVQQHIIVGIGSTVGITVSLQPGLVQQRVTVAANAAHIETETSEIDTVVTPEEIKDLPVSLNGDMRNPLNFVVLTPGVDGSVPGATPDYNLHFSGAASGADEVYTDGIPEMNPNASGAIGNDHAPIDAVSEFKVITNNQTAQYGLSSGIVSFGLKSGTNEFHGALFEFLQNDALNAAGFVTDYLHLKKAPLKQNEYGGFLGGPVRIPWLYNGHDKTFFFVDYTGFKYRPSANNATLTTIPNAERTGDFSQSLGSQAVTASGMPISDPAGRPVYIGEIYNPFSAHTVIGPDGKTYQVRDPFPGNIIPSGFSGLSAVSQGILKYFPTADNSALFNNFARLQSSKIDESRLLVKIDEHISDKQSVSGSIQNATYNNSNNGGLNLLDATGTTDPSTAIRLTYNYTHSPTLLNNLNIGYLRDNLNSSVLYPGPEPQTLGLTGIPGFTSNSPFPVISMTNINSIGSDAGGAGAIVVSNRYYLGDNVTMIRGSHSFTVGGEVRREQLNEAGVDNGDWSFAPTESALNGVGFANGKAVPLPTVTGNAVASFMFGGVDYTHENYVIPQYYRFLQSGVYVQDDWKARRNLTLNIGLRYDLQIPRTEKFGNVSSMDPTLPNPAAGGILGAYTFYGNGPGRNGVKRIGRIYRDGFQPRFGFAYTPGDQTKTVLRGGFAVSRPIGNDNLQSGITGGYDFGFAGIAQQNHSGDYLGDPAYYWDSPFPASGFTPPFSNLSPGILTGDDAPAWFSPKVGLPPTQFYWSFQIEQQVSSSIVAHIGYVGMHTYHLGSWSKPNEVNPTMATQKYSAAAAAEGLPLSGLLALPITDPRVAAAGITPPWPGFVSVMGPAATAGQALRPTPQYGDTDHPENPIGSVSYNGLQTSLQKRFSQGLTFLISYTFSKTIGDVDSNNFSSGAENAIFAASFFQDYYNSKAERAVTSSDVPHVVSLSYTYELPFGPGKPFASKGGIVGEIVGGWSVSGIQQYQSGTPIHIEYDAFGSSANPFFAGGDGQAFRPNIVPGQPFKNPAYRKSCSGPVVTPGRTPCQFLINPAAFTPPSPGPFGDAPNFISALRYPAYLDEDLSVSKRIKLFEKADLQIQANFFNAFNRVIFSSGLNETATDISAGAPPNLSPASLAGSNTIFGLMTNQQNAPRTIQFGMRLEF